MWTGNDGGSIPSRSELVKTKSAPKKVHETATANNEHAWKYCALSRAPLSQPLVSDGFGNLYNKDSIIQYILDEGAFGDVQDSMSHINSMKDVVDLLVGVSDGKYICEVTRRDMNGQTKFVYSSVCGHAVSAEALKNVRSNECLICSKACSSEDMIPLNPPAEEIAKLKVRMQALNDNGLTHSGAPQKKKKSKRKSTMVENDASRSTKRQQITNFGEAQQDPPQSTVLKSLLHSNKDRLVPDGFMTRGTSSRVG